MPTVLACAQPAVEESSRHRLFCSTQKPFQPSCYGCGQDAPHTYLVLAGAQAVWIAVVVLLTKGARGVGQQQLQVWHLGRP